MPVTIDLDQPSSPDGQPDKNKLKSAKKPSKPARKRSSGPSETTKQVLIGTVLAVVAVVALVFVGLQLLHGPRETGSNTPAPTTPQHTAQVRTGPSLGPLPLVRRATPGPGAATGSGSPAPVVPGMGNRTSPGMSPNQTAPQETESQDTGIH